MINVYIDEFLPYLKSTKTGEIYETEVIRIKRRSFLQNYNKSNGWYVNWIDFLKDSEVYALVIKGTVDIQGLVSITTDNEYQSMFITCMCVSPENDLEMRSEAKYKGIVGNLFAIVAKKSIDCGFKGHMHGYAINEKTLNQYVEKLDAEILTGELHPYGFSIKEKNAELIMEAHNCEWIDEEI